MIQNPILGQYVPGDSPLHRLDPRAKLLFVFCFMVVVFLANNGASYGLLAGVTVLAVGLSGVPVWMILRGLKPILYLILLTAILHLWLTRGGGVILEWGPFIIHRNGALQAGWISLRFLILILMGTLLTLTTSPIALTDGLERLLSPLTRIGVPAHELALMMSIALRFIPTLWEETDKIIKAQRARGADFESGGLYKRAKSYLPVLIPLFISSFRRAEDLALAMEARGYRGGRGRTRIRELHWGRADTVSLLILALLTVGLLWLRN
ncbi:energy-coupling factor transporter transmembrane protein EcfT [Kroppenstedtia guangzhouensis]|uniref:Energy-coupling factor transporter transmembrane protein EcfT n=1 Tax=Kroppenstedtia guangzhouensis TaxID=1274356 RepID=A0ABQ1GZV0_9BACL|nr:energy-coupling factor transporter transmembrane protein EcfT [Kroppenstedtia guangzhouensis]GGA53910.1 energy-coupling factor transporter transmembrane protein EcfT [Kroppenstedtia guangzhouensis]